MPPPAVHPLVALATTRGLSPDASENAELRTACAVYWSESLQERSEWEKSNLPVSGWIEMETAIVFLAFVASSRQAEKAYIMVTKASLKCLQTAVGEFKWDTDRLPTASEGLNALILQPSGVPNWRAGGYLETPEVPKDAWGHAFVYVLDPNLPGGFGIYSCGRDGVTLSQGNDADDIRTWTLQTSSAGYSQRAPAARDAMIHRAMSVTIVLLILAAVALILTKGFGRKSR